MPEIVMPRLSDSMEEGTILTWMKRVGEEVTVGEELVEIETDKANMAYESDIAGTLTEILAQEGDTLAIGAPIAVIGGRAEIQAVPAVEAGSPTDTPAGSSSAGDSTPPIRPHGGTITTPAGPAGVSVGEPEARSGPGPIKASPVARRIARDLGIDLTKLTGSGPGGRIVKADVESPPASVTPVSGGSAETAKGRTTYKELSRLQSVVVGRMAVSKATAPHFYLETEIDMSATIQARARVKAASGPEGVVPSINDVIVKACALALRQHPDVNAAYRDERFELYSRVNVGFAVAAGDALVVPTVFDADKKSLKEIAENAGSLARRVRDGSITPPELAGGTFTVSNLGMYGVTGFSAIINPPQAAILAVGAIVETPVIRDGEVKAAHLLKVTLSCDHRILYGAVAAEFLATTRSLLEEPLALAL